MSFHLEYFEDKNGNIRFEELLTETISQQLVPNNNRILNVGFTDSAYWIHFKLVNKMSENTEFKLEFAWSQLDKLDFYQENDDGSYSKVATGDLLPFATRPIPHRNFVFTLKVPKDRMINYFARIQSQETIQIPLSLRTPAAFHHHNRLNHLWFGFYFGIITIMILYNLFIFFFIRETSYLLYVLFETAFLVIQIFVSGFGYEYIWPSCPWWQNVCDPFMTGILLFWAILFVRDFLRVNELLPNVDRLYRVLLGLLPLVIILSLFEVYYANVIINYLTLFAIGMLFSSAIMILRKGNPFTKYLMWAFTPFIVCGLMSALRNLSILPNYIDVDNLFMISSIMEVTLLSLALAARMRVMKKEKEAAQLQVIKAYQAADLLKDEFLAKTSHELSTPLHGIIGITESLVDNYLETFSKEVIANLQLIIASARRLSVLINDILDVSKLKHKEIKLQRKAVDLHSCVSLVITLVKPLIGLKQLNLTNAIPTRFPAVLADENRLQQILLNLIGNAVKFTRQGSIHIQAKALGNRIEVQIKDTGIGIPQHKLEEIFLSFSQVESVPDSQYGGTGLGLSITRYLLELHEGTIRVESEPDKGTVVVFTLPMATEARNRHLSSLLPKAAESDLPATHQNRCEQFTPAGIPSDEVNDRKNNTLQPTVLVVDDEPINLKVLGEQLATSNYNVLLAQNGFEALDILEDQAVNLVLLDVMMPQMNGFEVCAKIREYENLATLPIIMLTALVQFEAMIKGLNSGANDYLTKPFNKNELLARINIHLSIQENFELRQNLRIYHKINDKLRLGKAKAEQVIDLIEEKVLVVNSKKKIVLCNQPARDFLGLLNGENVERNLDLFFPRDIQQNVLQPFLNPSSRNGSGKKINVFRQVVMRSVNGRKLPVNLSIAEIGPSAEKECAIIIHAHNETRVGRELDYSKRLIQVMVESLTIWEESTRKTKIELAEESGIWNVQVDRGNYRTKTMDKYLSLKNFPKKPRWKDVVKTARFVLSQNSIPSQAKVDLKQQLDSLLEMVHYESHAF